MRIVEILGRSTQGITRPFLCRGEDGAIYYVKGQYAGYWSLCCEWVAGELARRWALPVAPFAIVEVPKSLIQGSIRPDASELRDGFAFGSQLIENSVELRWNEIGKRGNGVELCARVLMFDWWVANPDRQLSELGGNPNLLWTEHGQKIHLIDHNLAFSVGNLSQTLFDFAEEHVFGRALLASEGLFYEGMPTGPGPLAKATSDLALFWEQEHMGLIEIWNSLPNEWTESAPDFTLTMVQKCLNRISIVGDKHFGSLFDRRG